MFCLTIFVSIYTFANALVHSGRLCRVALRATQSAELNDEISSMRVSTIKSLLTSARISVKGIFEKQELVKLLTEYERKELAALDYSSAPLLDVSLEVKMKKYSGIDMIINGKTSRFILDTGATMNLIKNEATRRLGLGSEDCNSYTSGFGGGGSIATSKVNIKNAMLGSLPTSFEAAIITNDRMLPSEAEGLLGLTFMSSLGGAVLFDFAKRSFSWSRKTSALLTPLQLTRFNMMKVQKLPSGLLITEVLLGGFNCLGMIDLGSTYTIANPLAVKLLGKSIEALETSSVICAGIDGRPMPMKILPSCSVQIGQGEADSSLNTLEIYAADIPGLREIGLGHVPAVILGVDVLRKHKLLLDFNDNKLAIL